MAGFMTNHFRSAILVVFHLNPVASISDGNIVSLNRIGLSIENLIIRLIGIGPPFPPIGTPATLTDPVRIHCIIFCPVCPTDSVRFQIICHKISFVAHVSPGTAFIIHTDDIPLHLRERCVVANDLFRLDSSHQARETDSSAGFDSSYHCNSPPSYFYLQKQ